MKLRIGKNLKGDVNFQLGIEMPESIRIDGNCGVQNFKKSFGISTGLKKVRQQIEFETYTV